MNFRVEARKLPANIEVVLDKLRWMRQQRIWPNGLRYLWTDAFGLVLLVSLHRQLGERSYLDEAESLVGQVDRVLGRAHGIRIGEAPDRDGQYFHYLAKWLFALGRLGQLKGEYRNRAIALARDIHRAFVIPGMGVIWKMKEDLSGPTPDSALVRSMRSTAMWSIACSTSKHSHVKLPKCAISSSAITGSCPSIRISAWV
jgi:hypothetical protein